jgi:hypothetical protein
MTRSALGQSWRFGLAAALAVLLSACSSSASTSAPASAPASSAPAASARASTVASVPAASAPAPASAAAGRTADPILANALATLNGLTNYQFKFTLKGGSYASSVGTGGVVGTVVNSPSFAVQFTYVDLEIIEVQGKNWTKNGTSWDLSKYPDRPTTYDSYGPAILLAHYFPASVAAYYTAAGDETVNGIPTTRYTADPKILNSFMDYWGVKAANGALVQAADMWIAKSGGYPVRWKVTATGGAVVPGSGGSADFEFLVDISKAGDPANVIHIPAS